MDDRRIERLEKRHDRNGFDCGKPPLNDFLRTLVNQYEKRNLGRAYVALRPGEKRVLGYDLFPLNPLISSVFDVRKKIAPVWSIRTAIWQQGPEIVSLAAGPRRM